MKLWKQYNPFLILVLTGMVCLAIFACQSQWSDKTLNVFFPDRNKKASQTNQIEPAPENKTASEKQKPVRQLVSHKPYLERKCAQCHKGATEFSTPIFGDSWDHIFRKGGGKPGPLVLPAQKICLACHKDLSKAWADQRGLILHKTASTGDCLKCHDAHQSRYKAMLIKDEQSLCVSCHNKDNKIGQPKCMVNVRDPKPCLSCHNPHLGKNKSLLTKDYREEKHKANSPEGLSEKGNQ